MNDSVYIFYISAIIHITDISVRCFTITDCRTVTQKLLFVVGRIGGTYVRADFSRIYRTMFRFYYLPEGLTGLMIGLSIIPRYAGITHTADHILLYEDITFWGNRTWKPVLSFSLEYPVRHPVSDSVRALFRDFLVDGSWPWQRWQIFSLSLPEEADSREVFLLQSCA